jgi:hypothetical protein
MGIMSSARDNDKLNVAGHQPCAQDTDDSRRREGETKETHKYFPV